MTSRAGRAAPPTPGGGPAVSWPTILSALLAGQDLDGATAQAALGEIMAGEASDAHVAGLLVALRAKGETAEELAGLARTMLDFAETVPVTGPLVDTCGTGGDRAGTFNISTVAAVVAAAAGARVAKHGNRAASSQAGSADLLEAWGVAIDLDGASVARCIEEVGIGFCFAPRFHPAMRHVMPARKALGVPTAFNLLGPLSNPARAAHQTVGVADPAVAETVAGVLARLGSAHALVFHGAGGLDELTTAGPALLWEVREGTVREQRLDPAALGLEPAAVPALAGGSVEENRAIADAVLAGEAGPRRDAVLLGAAAALLAADLVTSWERGLERAADAIDAGAAAALRDRWVARSQELAAR